MKKSKKILLMLIVTLIMTIGYSVTALAKEDTISVLAEADVPEGFTGKIIVNYEGENENNKISVILSQDNNYQQMYELKEDNYTLSGKKVENGSLVNPCTDFSLIGADTAQTYSLAFEVSEEEIVNNWSEDEMVEVSFEADVPEDFEDTMEIVYEGQDGYTIKAYLNKKNDYTEVVKATKSIYTKSKISTQETYNVDYIRGFTLENASNDNVYVLQFKVGEAKSFEANVDDVDYTVENTQATGAPTDVIFKLKEDTAVYEKLANTIITIEFAGEDGSLKKVTTDSTNGFMTNVSLTGNEVYDIVRISSNLVPDDEGNCEYNFTTEEARFTATADKVVTIVAVKNENYSAGFSLKDIPTWTWIVLGAVPIIVLFVILSKKRKTDSPSYKYQNDEEELIENFDEQEEAEKVVHREPKKEEEEVIDLTEDKDQKDFFEESEDENVSLEEEQDAFRSEAESNVVSDGLVDESDEDEDTPDEEENEDDVEVADSDEFKATNEEYQA